MINSTQDITPAQSARIDAIESGLSGLHPEAHHHLNPAEKRELAFFLRQKSLRSSETARIYHRQVEKFLFWLRLNCIHQIDEWALMDYQQALLSPTTAMASHPHAQFNATSQETVDQYMAPVRSLLSHLHAKGLLQYNPGTFVPRLGMRNKESIANARHFTKSQWEAVCGALEAMPESTIGEQNRKERLRFCILFGYGFGLRIREQASHTCQYVRCIDGHWVLDIVGKGNRARRLSFSRNEVAAQALTRYRRYLRLSEWPDGDALALLPSVNPVKIIQRGPNKGVTIKSGITPGTWEEQLKGFITNEVMAYLYPEDPASRAIEYDNRWSHLTPHSLRHTRITHLVDEGQSLVYVQKFAGHEKLDTTANYFHAEL